MNGEKGGFLFGAVCFSVKGRMKFTKVDFEF